MRTVWRWLIRALGSVWRWRKRAWRWLTRTPASRRWTYLTIGLGLGLIWWFPVCNALIKPDSYGIGILLMVVVLVALRWHFKVYRRYDAMVDVVRRAEIAGEANKGSTLYSLNQRFRYAARVVESWWALGVGVLSLCVVKWPGIMLNPNYGKYVVTYFLGTAALTGVLTKRDDKVLDVLEEMDADTEAATLTPLHHRSPDG